MTIKNEYERSRTQARKSVDYRQQEAESTKKMKIKATETIRQLP